MLLLFDIDGTLLHGAADAHRDALFAAIRAVHGIDPAALEPEVATPGRTDGEIARAILLRAGISAGRIEERAGEVLAECSRTYAELCTADLSHTVLPGNRELLEWLSRRAGVELSLLTGNYEAVARIKLRRATIGHYFPAGQGAFGSDSEDRAALPPIARRRAGDDGVSYRRERTIVIGDTPLDIACARADELRCFAVTTGGYDAAALRDADAVVRDAEGLRVVLERTLDTVPG